MMMIIDDGEEEEECHNLYQAKFHPQVRAIEKSDFMDARFHLNDPNTLNLSRMNYMTTI